MMPTIVLFKIGLTTLTLTDEVGKIVLGQKVYSAFDACVITSMIKENIIRANGGAYGVSSDLVHKYRGG